MPTPEVIQLRMNASAELRTHVFFEGVQISVMLSRSGDGAGGDGEEKDSSEGKEEEVAGPIAAGVEKFKADLPTYFALTYQASLRFRSPSRPHACRAH